MNKLKNISEDNLKIFLKNLLELESEKYRLERQEQELKKFAIADFLLK